MKPEVFTSTVLWQIYTELRNSPLKNICFFKNADSRFLMNTIICSVSVTLCEAQKPLAEMEILLVVSWLPLVSSPDLLFVFILFFTTIMFKLYEI